MKKEDKHVGLVVIIGILAAFFLARFLSSSPSFSGLTNQRGPQGSAGTPVDPTYGASTGLGGSSGVAYS